MESSDKKSFDSINPSTGKVWSTIPEATQQDVEQAVESAQNAFESGPWSKMTPTERGECLRNLGTLLSENSELLGKIESIDTGKMLKETRWQAKYISQFFNFFAGCADKVHGETLPIDKPDLFVFTTREPLGVIAAIVPWNSQLFLVAVKIGPALAAGNTIVLKASEHASAAMLEFGKLIDQAGFPKGVVSIVTGDSDNCAIPLTSHPGIDRIAFTGGTETAKKIIKNSANNFAATNLELGGKSPLVIFDDADIESAANGIIAGNFGASGQSCVAGSRVIVQKNISSKLKDLIKQKSENIIVGNPLDPKTNLGPLCTSKQIEIIENTINKSVSQGAEIIFGGKKIEKEGNYFEPTLIYCPHRDIETLKIEMFGPVISLIEFDSEEDAIDLANDSEYGLGSGLFTKDLSRAHRVSKEIKAGICWINTYRVISPIAAFGGFNQSGYAREAGKQSILDYTRTKTTWINTSDEPMKNPFVMR